MTATAEAAASRPHDEAAPSGRPAVLLLGWTAAIMSAGVCLAAVSLPSATEDLGLSPFLRSASASAPSLAIAASAIALGVAADRLGRRRLLMWAYALAAGASLAVIVVPSGVVYLAGNALAGAAYGVFLSATYAYLTAVVPRASVGRAIGLWGMSSIVIGTVASIGGSLLADADWRWLYAIVPAMCAVAAVLTPRLLPPMPRATSGPVDWPGIVLVGLGVVLLITGLLAVASDPASLVAWALIAAGVAALAAWVAAELRSRAPAFPLRLFRSRLFLAAVLSGLFVNGAYAAPIISLSDYLQYEKKGSVLVATLGLQPFYLIGALAWYVAGRQLSAGRSPRSVVALGALLAAAGFVALLPLEQGSAYWVLLPGSLLVGYGTNAALTGQSQVYLDAAPADAYGAVTASKLTVGQLGYSVGMILTTLVLSGFTARGILSGLTAAGESSQEASATLSALNAALLSGQPPALQDLSEVMRVTSAAFTAAFRVRMVVGAVVMGVTAAGTWLLMREPARAPGGGRE